jgi:hypothetical protein
MYLLEEIGEPDEAIRRADDYITRSVAWQADYFSIEEYRLALLRHLGRISDADLKAEYDALRARREQTLPKELLPQTRKMELWVTLHRSLVSETKEQAEADLKDAPDMAMYPWRQIMVAKRQLEAGHVEQALPTLRKNAAACTILPVVDDSSWEDTFGFMRTKVMLGQALEQTGDKAGACEAYAYVKRRWKNAKPRSVSLETSIQRSQALGCP